MRSRLDYRECVGENVGGSLKHRFRTGTYAMQSFTYWLLTAMAVGALLGGALRPSFLEVAIVWLVSMAAFQFWRRLQRRALAVADR
jgi:uncharacterized membrane protein YfcA